MMRKCSLNRSRRRDGIFKLSAWQAGGATRVGRYLVTGRSGYTGAVMRSVNVLRRSENSVSPCFLIPNRQPILARDERGRRLSRIPHPVAALAQRP